MNIERSTTYQKLLNWKQTTNGTKALMIEGARRIGKSTIARKFGEQEYKSYVVIDFANVPKRITDNFSDNLNNLDVFYQTISLEYNVKLYRRESLIIFDEIQKFRVGSSIEVDGIFVESTGKGQEYELKVTYLLLLEQNDILDKITDFMQGKIEITFDKEIEYVY